MAGKRILIICNTLFQVVVAVQLKLTLFANDEVDVHVSDHSVGSELVVNGLSRTGMFSKVEYRCTKDEISQAPRKKVAAFLRSCMGYGSQAAYPDYDEIIFYNLNMPVYDLADSAIGGSEQTRFSGMEEGVLSYGRMAYGKSPELLDRARLFTGHRPILGSIDVFYCFFPSIAKNNGPWVRTVEIPSLQLNMAAMREVLCEVFQYAPQRIKYPFVYFASSSDIDGAGYGETELVLRLADYVGRTNLLVKKHPRDKRTVYEDAGLAVMGRSDVPWEIAQICGVADESVCLTISSGSFINAAALIGGDVSGVFFAPSDCPSGNALHERLYHIEGVLSSLHEVGMCMGIQMMGFDEALSSNALQVMGGGGQVR